MHIRLWKMKRFLRQHSFHTCANTTLVFNQIYHYTTHVFFAQPSIFSAWVPDTFRHVHTCVPKCIITFRHGPSCFPKWVVHTGLRFFVFPSLDETCVCYWPSAGNTLAITHICRVVQPPHTQSCHPSFGSVHSLMSLCRGEMHSC